MLPTCRRCQQRKIRCDKSLPACSPCASVGLECSFDDPVSGETVPRSYIARLDENIRKLKAEITRLQRSQASVDSLSGTETTAPSSVELPSGTCIDGSLSNPYSLSFFQMAPPAFPSFLGAGSAVSYALASIQSCQPFFEDSDDSHFNLPVRLTCGPVLDKPDKSLVTMADIRELIVARYLPIIHRDYPILKAQELAVEQPLRRLPLRQRFNVLMAAAIGGAHAARNYPHVQTTASVLRRWAETLLEPILAEQDASSFQALLLLILYELVDPSRGLCWRLLGMACRLCVDLHWQREAEVGDDTDERPSRETLFLAFYDLEWQVCSALGRPAMLREDTIRSHSALTAGQGSPRFDAQRLQFRIHETIFQSAADFANGQRCPINRELMFLVSQLDSSPDFDIAWLQLQALRGHICMTCVTYERWDMEITRAANSVIRTMAALHRENRLLSIWLSASKVLMAGSALFCLRSKGTREEQHALPPAVNETIDSGLSTCLGLLTAFAENWPPAALFRDVMDRLKSTTKQQ
ncbi:hypothetical protein PV11_08234 [Exophiala sideris]|uniref:Zn(2)-C6 fungal-type domain-containing protein n=1 Tax=Exophiala sideris TaxID=1016849 RepID=A0A0D1WZW8_9EURO|nr:hypothetical protein PV11_08234 [Exophiala sideris]